MATRTVKFGFQPSASDDVTGYSVMIEEGDNILYEKVYAKDEFEVDPISGAYKITLNNIQKLQGFDGICTISVFAIDNMGNQSPESVLDNVELDFLAPAAPSGLFIEVL